MFFDFAAAFPSLEHAFMRAVIRAAGFPRWLRNFIDALYRDNRSVIALAGGRFRGFIATRGVRQGCPLSPLLFAVCSDILVRRLTRRFPRAVVRAYADDVAIVMARFLAEVGALQMTFADWALASGMDLHAGKTMVVPLTATPFGVFRAAMVAAAPLWAAVQVRAAAKYLGFQLGPGRGHSSYGAPLAKMESRALTWASMELGLFHAVEAYRVFIFSVVLFVAQLDPLPPGFAATERRVWARLAPGPGSWITPPVIGQLRALGFPVQAPEAAVVAVAARARVAVHDSASKGGLRIEEHCERINAARADPANRRRVRHFADGLSRIIVTHLRDARAQVAAAAADLQDHSLFDPTASASRKDGWQARATELLTRHAERRQVQRLAPGAGRGLTELFCHCRRRLERFVIPAVLPGRRVQRWLGHCRTISARLPPRVLAATLRAAFNGFNTERRHQRRAPCAFGCSGHGEDSVEHYAACPVIHDWAARKLRLARPPLTECVADFLGVAPWVASLPAHLRGEGEVCTVRCLRALVVYVTYRAHNVLRRRSALRGDIEGLLSGFLLRAVCGHPGAEGLSRRPWAFRPGPVGEPAQDLEEDASQDDD